MKIIKPGKIVLVLHGRFAGRKAVVLKHFDEGTKDRPYPHCIVAGIEQYPRKTGKSDSVLKVKRSKVKSFVRVLNYNHIMPTRYAFDIDGHVPSVEHDTIQEPTKRQAAREAISKCFQQRFDSGKNQWLFTKLSF